MSIGTKLLLVGSEVSIARQCVCAVRYLEGIADVNILAVGCIHCTKSWVHDAQILSSRLLSEAVEVNF